MEEWKSVKGFEGLYEVSNTEKVRSLDHYSCWEFRTRWGGKAIGKRFSPGCVLKQKLQNDYPSVTLCKDGKLYYCYVHRLVAEAFIPNPNNLPQIDHCDTNRHNNKPSNLRWVDNTSNMNNPLTKIKIGETRKKVIQEKGYAKNAKVRDYRLLQYRQSHTLQFHSLPQKVVLF